jgi:hypothetical protein
MTTLGKQIVAGALLAVSGAFVWALFSFSYWFVKSHNPGETVFSGVVFAGYAVFVASWFVLPIGAVIGVTLPRVIERCSPRNALLRGAVLGIVAAIVAAILTSILMEWATITGQATIVDREAWWRSVTRRFFFDLLTMSCVCALWVGVWAARWSRRMWANEHMHWTRR